MLGKEHKGLAFTFFKPASVADGILEIINRTAPAGRRRAEGECRTGMRIDQQRFAAVLPRVGGLVARAAFPDGFIVVSKLVTLGIVTVDFRDELDNLSIPPALPPLLDIQSDETGAVGDHRLFLAGKPLLIVIAQQRTLDLTTGPLIVDGAVPTVINGFVGLHRSRPW